MAIDPVCNMNIDEKDVIYQSEFRGKTYYFCSDGCKKAFIENPEKFMDKDHHHKKKHHGCCC
jgi:YHS domain-containing protein